MAQEGFDYIPFVPPAGDPVVDAELTPEEFAAEFGFGLSTGVRDGGTPLTLATGPEAVDPNLEIVQSMEPLERIEYHRSLYGPAAELDESSGYPIDMQQTLVAADESSCLLHAQEEAFAGEAFWTEFGAEWTDVVDRALADPRLVEVRDQWASCMAAEGYDFPDQPAMQAHLLARLDAVVSYPSGSASDRLFAPPEPTGAAPEPDYDPAELAALIDEEIAIATLSLECSAASDEVFAEVLGEYEQAFVENNLDRLEKYRRDR